MSRKKKIPKFKSEYEERDFWIREDSTGYVDWYHSGQTALDGCLPDRNTAPSSRDFRKRIFCKQTAYT
jgi:hypothetical protein